MTLRGSRRDISNKQILDLLAQGISCSDAALRLGCTPDIVYRARDGRRKDPKPAPRIPKDRLCRCCQTRRIAPGFRWLCKHCHSTHNATVFDWPAAIASF